MFLLGIFAHGGEAGDPVLFDWIRHQIDDIVNLGPGAIVISLGAIVVIIPIVIVITFLLM